MMKESAVLFSVIIPCYKMGRFVNEALESVGKQTYGNWEIIVVDDHGPDDGTDKIVADFARRFPSHRVELIRHEKNGGVSQARNTAIEAAKGDWVAFLDPDDYWFDHHLQSAVNVFKVSPNFDVVASPVESFTETNGNTDIFFMEIPPLNLEYFPASLAYCNFIQPSAAMVRKELLERVGGFDTTPELQHIEDYDLWIRLAKIGSKFFFLPCASCRYRKHPGGATSDSELMRRLHQELYKKHTHFFIGMQSQLLHSQSQLLSLQSIALMDVKKALFGPFARNAIKVDQLFARLEKKLKEKIRLGSFLKTK